MQGPATYYDLCAASAALAVGCTVSYLIYKLKRGRRNAADLFDYLIINTVTTEESCDQVVEELRRRCQKHRALGFDCEWVTDNGKRQPVALVQLSSFDGYCGLFRLSTMKTVPASLKELLEEETIYKVGVAAADDGNYLSQDDSVVLKSTLDIRYLAELNGFEAGGLATLSSTLLDIVLDKSWRIRCSDWEAEELSEKQVQYAAIDAHVAIRIFAILLKQLGQKQTVSYWNRVFGTNSASVWSHLDEYCSKYADVQYKMKHVKLKDGAKEKDGRAKEPPLVPTKGYKLAMRAKPLYNNCYLEAPDGELLTCRCDNKKALWFVNKELADVVNEDPFTVRLRFEPAGRAVGDVGRYYRLEKENKCVVCGSTNSYIRKNVVPREYRKMFPEIMKEHASHDVVLLCAECHQLSNMRDHAMRERLADMCDAPLATNQRGKKYNEFAGKFENSEYESHGVKVVEYFFKHGGLLRLEELWREHFLNSMEPSHMPALWSVKHNEEKLLVKWNEGRVTQEHLKSIGLTRL